MDADWHPSVPDAVLEGSVEIPGGAREHRIKSFTNSAGAIAGWHVLHRRASGEWCMGTVNIDPNTAQGVWQLIQLDPLTIDPSILCRTCGEHGYIREGQWVDA
jgi:hypothetical protein